MSRPLTLAVLTTGRQDWGLLRPLCTALKADQAFSLALLVGGMACSETFGRVANAIREQEFEVAAELPWEVERADAAAQASEALRMTAAALAELGPDALVILGDRYETAAAALAATICRVPIVHLYGGEETEGAFDNSLRHAITKMSHLHLVAHRAYAAKVLQMGEDPASVHVVGSLAVDNLRTLRLPDRAALERLLGVALTPPVGVVTVHPATLAEAERPAEVSVVVEAMEAIPITWVVTLPNADPGNAAIRAAFLRVARERDNVVAVAALGEESYLGLLKIADVVVGNSSSGITEAPAAGVPSVNIGDRELGRIRCQSIIDVPSDAGAVIAAIHRALSPGFRAAMVGMAPVYGTGESTARILDVLRAWIPPRPPRKRFFVLPPTEDEVGVRGEARTA